MSKWICNTFCPQANNRKLLHFASHFSARRECWWPGYTSVGAGAGLWQKDWQNLKHSSNTSKYWYQPNAWVTMSHCAWGQTSVCLCTSQHKDVDLIKIHLKSTGKTSFDFGGLDRGWKRVVFEPKVLFVFSTLKFLIFFTLLEKNISKSKVYPPGCTQKKQGSSSA